jgi:hypothetical protein
MVDVRGRRRRRGNGFGRTAIGERGSRIRSHMLLMIIGIEMHGTNLRPFCRVLAFWIFFSKGEKKEKEVDPLFHRTVLLMCKDRKVYLNSRGLLICTPGVCTFFFLSLFSYQSGSDRWSYFQSPSSYGPLLHSFHPVRSTCITIFFFFYHHQYSYGTVARR